MSELINFDSRHSALEPQRSLKDPSTAFSSSDPTGTDGILRRAPTRFDLYQQSNLTTNQLQIWIGQALVPETPIYHLAVALNIRGEIDPKHFQKAFQLLINSSDALRTVVQEADGIPIQRVLPELKYVLDFVDLSHLSEKQQRIKGWMEDRCQTPLNWGTRLFDSALIKLAAKKFVWYLNVHHLICDGWSFELIYRHMAELYQQSVQGCLPKSVPLLSFADYVAHERAHRESPRYRRAEAYWKRRIAENGELISFYGKVPDMATTRTQRISYDLGLDLTTKLKSTVALASPGSIKGTSLLDVFAALLVAYLHCLNGKQGYTIGIPFHNRRSKAFKGTIGFFSEILPVRIDVADDDTFVSLIGKVRDEVFRAARHGQHSIANSHFRKVYEVVVNYHTRSFRDFARMRASPDWIHNGHGDDSLALQLHDFGASGGLVLDFDLHRAIFNERESKQAVRHFSRVLQAFVADPHQPLQRLTLLSPAEARRLVVEWNRGVVEPTGRRCVHEIFEEQVATTPNNTAVILEDKQLTYHELNQRANKLAHYLRRRGVGPETLVGLYVERSLEMLVALLGILKAGAAYVPLDPDHPRDWLKFVLEDIRAPILLTQQRLRADLPQDGPEIICLDSLPAPYDREREENLKPRITGDHLAYVVYTSGSTGAPKGVEIPHNALVNFTKHAGRYFGLKPSDRVLQFASISFDTAMEEIFPCLTRGSTLVLRSDSMFDSVPVFLERCRELRITVLDLPTAYWHELTTRLFSESLAMPEMIRLVIIGGERAVPQRLALWRACAANRVRLLNTYGPTEATVAATMCDLTNIAEDRDSQGEVPIGRPIANVKTYVLDQNLNPVPVGVPGELYVGGVGLARGYLNRPELTAEKFLPNPFSKKPRARLYKTGDLVRYRSDGNLEFLRRIDRQVKVRGFRVELEGIEAVLRKHPLIQEAVVVQESASTQRQLVGCLVPKEAAALNVDEVRAYVAKRLPEYMVPATFVVLDSLPLTPSGKVNLQALPLPEGTQREPPTSYVPPRSPTEEQIARIWSDVLRLERVSRDDHFFQLGGHSLLAIQVISRIRKEFEVDIALRAIFEAPTIADLAQRVEEAIGTGLKPSEIVPSVPPPGATQAPLSFSQTRIWFMDQLAPESAAYNIAATVRFTGILHKEALKQSLNEVVRRHESLRTTFRNTGGDPVQVVTRELVLEMPEIDLRGASEASRLQEAKRLLQREASRPFDLERGPLLSVLLCQLDEEDQILLLNMHHAISDQWSLGIIVREITSLYNGFCNASPARIEPLPVQYSNFAVSQSRYLAGARWETQLSYWKKQLSDLQPLDLPTDHLRPSVQTFHGAHDQLSLSTHMVEGLRKLSLQENATLFMAFLAAFKALLLRYSGQEDIAIGSPIANRNKTEWEGVVGTFINILVLRTDLSGNPTFREVLRRVREVVLEAFAHQEMPFEKLVEALQCKRDPSRSPLVQVLFNFHNPPAGKINLAGLSWVPFEIDQWSSQFDIGVTIDPEITRKIWVAYNTDLYEAATIARMLKHYAQFLEAVAEDPDRPIEKIRILTDPERRQLLVDWNATTRDDYPKDKCLHELFEARVQQSPDAPAVVFENKQLTYQELNHQANRLAHRLQELGVGPEVLIGVCFERSLEMVVALLGILKAGGAYVPIDPAYPLARIAFTVEDSGMHLLLTQKKLVKHLRQIGRQIVSIEGLIEESEGNDRENPLPSTKPQNLAYVIYTSGSTGKPKGVQVEHKAVVNFLCSMRQKPGISSQDILLSVTTISFDIAVLELFLPLIVGARVVLVSREVAFDGRQLKEQLENSRATIMQGTPVTWQILLDAGWKAHRDFKILCGGEALSLNLAKALLKSSSSVWNLYGPTETAVWSTACEIEPGGDRVFIGRPIVNTQVHILDSHLEPVPVGVPGELYIGGDGLARGYLNRPELTDAKFIHNPFSNDPKGRLYKTGDCARYLQDGNIEFLGRKDYQIKIRGFRVEPGEAEVILSHHPTVKQAVVLAREDMPGEKQLVAYIVPDQQAGADISELRLLLKARLPEYMVPSAFVLLERLPLTQNGKLDREALPAPDKDSFESETGFVTPRDPVELQLTKIWEELLNIKPIGVKDNFFDLGGHSLLAVRLGAQIEKILGKNFPLATLFQAPTIEQLARFMRQEEPSTTWSSLVALQPHGSKPPFFWVHGELSDAFLPRYLGPDQPLYGLEHQSQDGKRALYTSVENIAAHYLKEIRTVQPEGPYFLGGFCFGGMVALEVTQQLRELGQETALLVMLNPSDPTPNLHNTLPRILLFWNNLSRHFLSLPLLRPQKKLTYVLEKVKRKLEETIIRIKMAGKGIVKSVVCKVSLGLGYLLPPFVRSFYILKIYDRARRDYLPQIYPGRLIIFKGAGDSCNPQSWERLAAGGLEIHEVPGDHVDILKEPHVRVWAEQLKDHLQKNQTVVLRSQTRAFAQ